MNEQPRRKFESLIYQLRRDYHPYPATRSACSKCDGGSARGGGHCADCIEEELAELVGDDLASDLRRAIEDQNAYVSRCLEKLESRINP